MTHDIQPLVRIENADVYVERAHVLHSINWIINPGEHWRVTGGNGSGKSTLLRLVAGVEHPAYGGSIARCLPRNGGPVRDIERIRRGIRLVSDAVQAGYAYDVSALELVLSGLDNTIGVYRAFDEGETTQAQELMRLVGTTELAARRIRSLSTGQLRRCLIARALMGTPDMLLLDEPCSGLDAEARTHILDTLGHVAAQGVHIVLVSHNTTDTIPAVTREARMECGRLCV